MAMGRPTKLTDEVCEAICKNIAEGNTLKYSCQKEDVTYTTFTNWVNRGKKAKSGKFFDFFNAVKKAKEESKNRLVKGIEEHGYKNWQALAWLLERQYPSEFGRRENVKLEHKGRIEHKTELRFKGDVQERILEEEGNGKSE